MESNTTSVTVKIVCASLLEHSIAAGHRPPAPRPPQSNHLYTPFNITLPRKFIFLNLLILKRVINHFRSEV